MGLSKLTGDHGDPEGRTGLKELSVEVEHVPKSALDQRISIADFQEDPDSHRHGNLTTASSHIITAIIGAGVLGLPQTLAWLGWIAGPILITAFYLVTLLTSTLLASVYEVKGVRHRRYPDAVKAILGRKGEITLAVFQYLNLVLSGIAYTIAAGESGRAIMDLYRCHSGECTNKLWWMLLPFGVIQLFFSQLPDLDSAWWASAIGAAMSIGYSVLAFAMCASKADRLHGTIGGFAGEDTADKVFGVFNALGTVAFAYNFATVLLEIQDTLRQPPKAKKTMVKAINISISTSFLFYIGVAITGYMAYGNAVPDQILTASGLGPKWTLTWANVMVFIHMISAYQVYSQPVFATCEPALRRVFPKSIGRLKPRVLSIVFRSLYVAGTTFISCLLPFFSSVIGLVGALVFWPAAVFFPIAMYTTVYPNIARGKKAALTTLNAVMLVVAVVAAVGAMRDIVKNSKHYKIFS
ncbi:hypothetical protein N2152v2_004445 [Parachlorella kessleri]